MRALPFLILVLSLVAATEASAQDYMVIVNDAVPAASLPPGELERIFQKRAIRWPNGLETQPVDQSESSPVRERFSRAIFGRSTAQIKAYWQTQIFSGRQVPPVEMASDREVLTYVQSNAGAVGYVSTGTQLPEGVRRLRVGAR